MLVFTPQMLTLIRDQIRKEPFAAGEMRRMVGLGLLYASLAPKDQIGAGHIFLYSMKIDDVLYYFYRPGDE